MSEGDHAERAATIQQQPWYIYAVVAALVGGGSGYVIQGNDVTLSELSRDLGERDARIEKLENVIAKFELRCLQLTERVIRIEVEIEDHDLSRGLPKRRSDLNEKRRETMVLCDFNENGKLNGNYSG